MSEMVERVARVLAKASNKPESSWWLYIKDSRLAIAAMREPTRHMVESGDAFQSTLAAWRSMIDEALK